jgi:translation initiation factor IF-2
MTKSQIELDELVTVGTLADKLLIPVSTLIMELMKNGVLATVNEKIDFDTAQIIVTELGLDIELIKKVRQTETIRSKKDQIVGEHAPTRPPVVAVMGHVDHGKTSILDAIRSSNVVKSESGGITQHISAYQVKHNNRIITFLDTPGHEAFAAIREHGAQLTDIVIIVIAADDGVKPQTIEAIRFAQNAKSKILVAINKIDKEGADVNRIKQQLSENGLTPEEWGGDTVICEVSAKNNIGIDKLLDMVLLLADIEELRADIDVPARGLVIESHIETGRGPVARLLVEAGILKTGDYIVAGSIYAKIKTLQTTDNQTIQEAGPSTPVTITGLKALPEFGDQFISYKTEKIAKEEASRRLINSSKNDTKMNLGSTDLIRLINRNNSLKELNVIIKADVMGSITSVVDSLKGLDNNEVAVRVVSSSAGQVVENDIYLAKSSNSIIYGFNIDISKHIKDLARREKIEIKTYKIIYELIDDVKDKLSDLLAPEITEIMLGKLIIKGIFKTTAHEVICGGEVVEGKLSFPATARIIRGKEELSEVNIVNLKKGTVDAKEVIVGDMCGVSLKTDQKLVLEENDQLVAFRREVVARKL